MDLARARLTEERKTFASARPVGTWAKPCKAPDGSVDLFKWQMGIRPAASSKYALPDGETLRVILTFPKTYPASPPGVAFSPPIFHTNVWPDGRVCLSLLLEEGHHGGMHAGYWQASRSFTDIVNALRIFLDEPNADSIANDDACAKLKTAPAAYWRDVAKCVAAYPAALAQRVEAEKR